MAATPSLLIRKESSYEGGTKQWSNRYHFNGGTPANSGEWTTFADAVIADEKQIYTDRHTIIEAVGYAAGSDVPVWSKTYSVAGTFAIGSDIETPLEVSALARYDTTARSTKNHPIYLFNYYRGGLRLGTGTDYEKLSTNQRSNIGSYSAGWISGYSDGAHTLVRAGPNGATATGHNTDEYLTHRDFPT